MNSQETKNVWDKHWQEVSRNALFNNFLEFYRKNIIAHAVRFYFDRYFDDKGIFVECGSGTSQTSCRINKKNRKLVTLDISHSVTKQTLDVEKIDSAVTGDINNLPFKNNSICGIWNLGVMEHFEKPEIQRILKEFNRVVRKGGRVILFWPPVFGSSEMVINVFEFFKKQFGNSETVFPDECSRLKSRAHLKELVKNTGFKIKAVHFSCRDFFTHMVVVLEKK